LKDSRKDGYFKSSKKSFNMDDNLKFKESKNHTNEEYENQGDGN